MGRGISWCVGGRAAIAATALMLVPQVASAQTSGLGNDSATIVSMSAAFFDAIRAARWAEAARMLDTTVLESMRHRIADDARTYRAMKPVTARQLIRGSPEMSRAVAAYLAKESSERIRALANATEIFGVSGPDSLLALPLQVFGQRWLEVHDERWGFREAARRCGHGDPEIGVLEPYRVVGSIVKDSVAYVLYDPGAERAPAVDPHAPRSPRVMVLRWQDGGWVIIPRDGLIGLGDLVNACG